MYILGIEFVKFVSFVIRSMDVFGPAKCFLDIGREWVGVAGCLKRPLWVAPEGRASVIMAISFCCRGNCFILLAHSRRHPNKPEQMMSHSIQPSTAWLMTAVQFVSVMKTKCPKKHSGYLKRCAVSKGLFMLNDKNKLFFLVHNGSVLGEFVILKLF